MKNIAIVIFATLLVSILSVAGAFQWKKFAKAKSQGLKTAKEKFPMKVLNVNQKKVTQP